MTIGFKEPEAKGSLIIFKSQYYIINKSNEFVLCQITIRLLPWIYVLRPA